MSPLGAIWLFIVVQYGLTYLVLRYGFKFDTIMSLKILGSYIAIVFFMNVFGRAIVALAF